MSFRYDCKERPGARRAWRANRNTTPMESRIAPGRQPKDNQQRELRINEEAESKEQQAARTKQQMENNNY